MLLRPTFHILDKISFNISTDYYISHGNVDQVIPIELGKRAVIKLESLNLKISYSEYPVGHGVTPQNFYSFKEWILKRI